MDIKDIVPGETYMWDGTDGEGHMLTEPIETWVLCVRTKEEIAEGHFQLVTHDPYCHIPWFINASSLSPIQKDA